MESVPLPVVFTKKSKMRIREFEKQLLISFGDKEVSTPEGPYPSFGEHGLFQYEGRTGAEYYGALFKSLREIVTVQKDQGNFTINLPESLREQDYVELLLNGIWLLKFFTQINFTGPPVALNGDSEVFLKELDDLKSELVLDGESIVANVYQPAVLLLAQELFKKISVEEIPSVTWWVMRTDFLHEKVLEEKSNILWTGIKAGEETLKKELLSGTEDNFLGSLLCLELAQMYLFHYDVTTAKDFVSYASTLAGISVTLAGALGKRTRYQQHELAQLIVQVSASHLENVRIPPTIAETLPKDIPLNDDTRLNKIQLANRKEEAPLNPIQQIILLNFFFLRKSFQAEDDVTRTECEACLRALLDNPSLWVVQYVSLLHRSLLERNNSRSVGRSLEQLESLKENFKSESPGSHQRLSFFFSSFVPMWFKLEAALADIYISLGSVNSALDVYLRLGLWEDAIDCYNTLQLRHKAEEIVKQEMEKGETVKLWCLLGDATDNVEHYEKAWNLSKFRSARTQRQWGYYHFRHKQYPEAIEHLEKAVELNPLEYPVWLRLAYAAMQIDNWELCAKAYRHACILDSDNFETWNNLANAYLKLGDKPRAMKVLIEATKCDYNIWQVWENLLVVATDCRAFEEAIRAYARLMDLKDKHADAEVLGVLTRFICENREDYKKDGSIKYLKPALKLFGRITAKVTTNGAIWKQYSDLLATEENFESGDKGVEILHRSVDCAQKSVRCVMQDPKWDRLDEQIKRVVEYTQNLTHRTLEFINKYPESASASNFKVTAMFTSNRVVASLKKRQSEIIHEVTPYDAFISELESSSKELSTPN